MGLSLQGILRHQVRANVVIDDPVVLPHSSDFATAPLRNPAALEIVCCVESHER